MDNPAPRPARDPVGLFTVERRLRLVEDGCFELLALPDRAIAVDDLLPVLPR